MKNKLGQESAFSHACANSVSWSIESGISKRFYVACAAMQGMLANSDYAQYGPESIAKYSYQYADELLAQEDKY